jgi:3-oxoacyl-[acyl-carrier protein] reductase
MPRLEDRVIIVTGGGHGIGRAYCEGIAREGGKPVVVDVDGKAAERVASEISEHGGDAMAMSIDVSSEAQTKKMADETIQRFGRVDGLVNNAAIFLTVPLARASGIEEMTVEEWDRVMGVNVRGVFLCCKAVVPHMKERNYGKIVNISSTTALQGLVSFSPYATSKSAIIGITRGLARDLGAHNITVNAVAPGMTLSNDEVTEEMIKAHESRMNSAPVPTEGRTALSGSQVRAIRRVQTPDDLVGAILFLCSAESDFISGQMLTVDGGSYMG